MTRLHPDLVGAKSTTKALVEANGGSEACSEILGGKSASLLRSYGNHNNPDRFMPLDDVIVLEPTAGRPIVSAWMVERAKADPDRQRRRASIADLACMAREGSEAKLAWAAAYGDPTRKPDAADRQRLARELRDVIALFGELLEAVEEGE